MVFHQIFKKMVFFTKFSKKGFSSNFQKMVFLQPWSFLIPSFFRIFEFFAETVWNNNNDPEKAKQGAWAPCLIEVQPSSFRKMRRLFYRFWFELASEIDTIEKLRPSSPKRYCYRFLIRLGCREINNFWIFLIWKNILSSHFFGRGGISVSKTI